MELRPAGRLRAEFLPDPEPTPRPAPSSPIVEIVSTASSRDYLVENWIGTRLTPEHVAGVFRQADFGQPALMFDMFESVVLTDGHTRGLYEQRLDEVAAAPWTLRPGDDRPGSLQAVDPAHYRPDARRRRRGDRAHRVGPVFRLQLRRDR